jgi:hypothetical protein
MVLQVAGVKPESPPKNCTSAQFQLVKLTRKKVAVKRDNWAKGL